MRLRLFAPAALLLGAVLVTACWSSLASSDAGRVVNGSSTQARARVFQLADFASPSKITLNGAGANSIAPFFEKVFYDYEQLHSKVTINYSPAGSSVGIKDIQENTVDFGDSEIPMSASALAAAKGGTVLQVPVELGGVAISYNVPGAPNGLRLDGPTLAAIFDGAITNWDSPVIAKVSGVSNLPNLPIVPVHRADSSGPGWDLDEYLISTSTNWVLKIGTSKASTSWPLPDLGEGEQLNTGVATFVKDTPGAIGFVSFGYASKAGFTNAALENGSGAYVAPSSFTIGQAGAQATHLSASSFSIIDESGPSTYPLANFSWTLLYKKQTDTAKGSALAELFYYVVTTGQQQAKALGYSPLPANVALLAKTALAKLRSSSAAALFRL